jgi:tetratricopeptide (TPR) repeat protein
METSTAAALKRSQAEAYKRRADALLKQGALEEAAKTYRIAVNLAPDFLAAENNLALAYLGLERYDHAHAIFQSMLARQFGLPEEQREAFKPSLAAVEGPPAFASPVKIAHWIEQLAYLIDRGRVSPTFRDLVQRYQALLPQVEREVGDRPSVHLRREQLAALGGYFDRVVHYVEPSLSSPTLNPATDFTAVEEAYLRTGVVPIDNLLSEEALTSLRRFLLESTVFFHYGEGFAGAYLSDGFSCRLVLQIAAELKQHLPRVLEGCSLTNVWAYRYGPSGAGVRPHNDDGTVTINFWLTPDTANLSAEGHGGLILYDRERPAEWEFEALNLSKDDPAVEAQLEAYVAGATETTIPYACNRAVMFCSRLFHKSEPFQFREGFENRRVNVTLLFLRRGEEP